jgi:imidazolonepropionase
MLKTPLLIKNIGELVSLRPLAEEKRLTQIQKKDLGIYRGAWMLIDDRGQVEAMGEGEIPDVISQSTNQVEDAHKGLVLPGFVDSHTHLIWSGSRAGEMERRLAGETYQQIAASGGGIRSTVSATRGSSDEVLLELCLARAKRALGFGITTIEAKSGYGLSLKEELRLLRIIKRLESMIPQSLYRTCLALHASSPEHATLEGWTDQATKELLPAISEENLAHGVDAFIDEGYFNTKNVEPYVLKAQELGLDIRLHADEFSDAGAALAAARWGAKSADHLQFASREGVQAMAQSKVTATVLPGTSLYTRLPFTSGRVFADAGVPVAIATDFNPGSCMIDNLPMLATVGCIHSGLTPAEAIAGITLVAAHSLGLGRKKGALAPGYDGDFVLYRGMPSTAEWIADFGRTAPSEVWIRGTRFR